MSGRELVGVEGRCGDLPMAEAGRKGAARDPGNGLEDTCLFGFFQHPLPTTHAHLHCMVTPKHTQNQKHNSMVYPNFPHQPVLNLAKSRITYSPGFDPYLVHSAKEAVGCSRDSPTGLDRGTREYPIRRWRQSPLYALGAAQYGERERRGSRRRRSNALVNHPPLARIGEGRLVL